MCQEDFWMRNALQKTERAICLEAVQERYREYIMEEFGYQGYCSFTLLLTPRKEHIAANTEVQNHESRAGCLVVQLRPLQHALDLNITYAAYKRYAPLAPTTRALDLHLLGNLCAFEMNRLEGTPIYHLQPRVCSDAAGTRKKRETFVTSFANAIAQGLPKVVNERRRDSVMQTQSPFDEKQTMLSQCTGKVGSRIVHKLEKLAEGLPDLWLRQRAQSTLNRILVVDSYPVVLNHGDLIPSNILVDKETWEIAGLVDWAEAEYLPFGTCLYGLDHVLGFLQPAPHGLGTASFIYYDGAQYLRELFWMRLLELVPQLGDMHEEIRLMRDLGVLLWHGYAWDDGAIDRVVDEVNDGEELAKLRAFLRAQ